MNRHLSFPYSFSWEQLGAGDSRVSSGLCNRKISSQIDYFEVTTLLRSVKNLLCNTDRRIMEDASFSFVSDQKITQLAFFWLLPLHRHIGTYNTELAR